MPNLHMLLSNAAENKINKEILWAYKKELLGFSSHRGKREKKIKKEIKQGKRDMNTQDPFELFVGTQKIRYVYYKETENILGNTYGMLILQDFEALTPNILARTIETVEGGGLVVLLLKSMTSLKQLYTLSMDVYARYRTEAHSDVVARFNERFLLSLRGLDKNSLVIDDEMNVLPALGERRITRIPPSEESSTKPKQAELKRIKESLEDVQPAGDLVGKTKTVDQANALLTFIDAISEKTLRSTVSLTAGRGRGKSAAMGLAIAAAVAHGYSNIFVTSPSPENLKTLFQFIALGLKTLGYEAETDFEMFKSANPEFKDSFVRINIHMMRGGQSSHRQTVQYIQPSDSHVLGQAELVVIDEAAAIPLPLVKKLFGPYLVFMASTINGYEGTGRSLSLKLIEQLRQQSVDNSSMGRRNLREISLDEPIRYSPGDPVEKWLNQLLCLDATIGRRHVTKSMPELGECNLYYINRDALFSSQPVSEAFLQKIMGLYVASHYKNSPNDLQLLSDAPAHQLFVLLGPNEDGKLPEPICVIQVALEGEISKKSILSSLGRGKRAGGDLIPWVVSQQFQDDEFATLSGARIVRIATNPNYTGQKYGSRAMELLKDFYKGKFTNLSEDIDVDEKEHELARVSDKELEESALHTEELKPKDAKKLPPLLLPLAEKRAPKLDYIGVSYGMTQNLLNFWKRSGFAPVYLRQTSNDLTGEHTCVMLNVLKEQETSWLADFCIDFKKRFLALLAFEFRDFTTTLALKVIEAVDAVTQNKEIKSGLTKGELDRLLSPYDLKRLESYANNTLDYHVIIDLLPLIATLYYDGKLPKDFTLSPVQKSILLGIGLQKKKIEDMAKEHKIEVSQSLAMFAKLARKVAKHFRDIQTKAIDETMPAYRDEALEELDGEDSVVSNAANGGQDVEQEDDDESEEEVDEKKAELRAKQREYIDSLDMDKYAIPQDADWNSESIKKAAKSGGKISVKSSKNDAKRKSNMDDIVEEEMNALNKKQKKQKKSKR